MASVLRLKLYYVAIVCSATTWSQFSLGDLAAFMFLELDWPWHLVIQLRLS
jgi:hypothetical protein